MAGFPYWESKWDDKGASPRWNKSLERTGVAAVKTRLSNESARGPAENISFGDEMMPKGFAEDWLAWHEQRRVQEEQRMLDLREQREQRTLDLHEQQELREQRMLVLQERMVSLANGSKWAAIVSAAGAFLSIAVAVVIAWKQL